MSKPGGRIVLVGGGGGRLLGPLGPAVCAVALSKILRPTTSFFLASVVEPDLLALLELHETGKLKPVIDRIYSLTETAVGLRYLETGHARGKVIVRVAQNAS